MEEKDSRNGRRKPLDDADQQRLVITLGIIAAAIGVYAIPEHKPAGWLIIQVAITVQATLAFLYIIFTAASLKYKGTGSLFDINPPSKVRYWFYDQSIEMFWATLYAGIASLLFATVTTKILLYGLLGFVGLTIVLAVGISLYKRKR